MMRPTILVACVLILMASSLSAFEFYQEPFTEGLPLTWTVADDLGGVGGRWVDDNPAGRTGFTYLTEPFLIADSSWYSGLPFLTTLTTPPLDCSLWSDVYMYFSLDYQDVSLSDRGEIYISSDGGGSWTKIGDYTGDFPDQDKLTDISAYADGEPDVRIRFLYSTAGAANQGWWAIDHFRLSGNGAEDFLFFLPDHQAKIGVVESDVDYSTQFYNHTGQWAAVYISYTGNAWPVDGPVYSEIGNEETVSLWAIVSIPISAAHGQSDTLTVQAVSGDYSAATTMTTTAVYYWTELDPVPAARGDGAAAVDGSRLFFIGGTTDGQAPNSRVDIYNTDSNAWSTGSAMPTPLTDIAGVGLSGIVYIPGGNTGSTLTPTLQRYDVTQNAWSTGADAPEALAGYAVVTDGADIYRIGGCTQGQWGLGTVNFDRYDVSENSWSSLTDMPTARVWAAAAHIEGKIYVAGGKDSSGTASDTLDVYDIAGNTWNSVKSPLPGAWWGGASAVYCETFFVFGGVLDGAITEKTFYYDPDTDTWTEVAFLNDPRFGLAGAGNNEIGLFAGGGWNPLWTAHDTFETFNRCLCGCYIDETCWEDGAVNPENQCEICDIAREQYGWSDNDGASCDDQLWCNGADSCLEGACSSHEFGEGDPRCPDDSLFCTGEEFCDEASDRCEAGGDPCADDGLWCNGAESCDEASDQCETTGNPCPDDDLFCTGLEGCNEAADQCTATGDPCPDDGQWCNGDEFCDEETDQCDAVNVPECPDDGVFCNGNELCDEENDQCGHAGDPCADDQTFCNGSESCDEDAGQCVSSGNPCPADDLFCNGAESCDEENDQCDHSGDPCPAGEECNEETDQCDDSTGNDDDDLDDDDDDTDDDVADDDGPEEVKEGEKGGCTCG